MTYEYKTKENVIYVRKDKDGWSSFARSLGEGIMLRWGSTKEEIVEMMRHSLWALNTFGKLEYHEKMAQYYPPSEVSYPVEEMPR